LSDSIRAKVFSQNLHQPSTAYSQKARLDVLDHSWFLAGDYGFKARCSTKMHSPINRLLKDGAIKMPFFGRNRIFSVPTCLSLLHNIRRQSQDNEAISIIEKDGIIDRHDLANKLSTSTRQLDYRIRKEVKNWNVFKLDNQIWHWSSFLQKFEHLTQKGSKSEIQQITLEKILHSYPFLSLDQLSFLSGINKYDLTNPLLDLAGSRNVITGIDLKESSEELISKSLIDLSTINWKGTSPFVLEKEDPLVEIVKTERNFQSGNGNYWIFVHGLPQAEFNFRKQKDKKVSIEEFRRLPTAELEIPELLTELEDWGRLNSISLDINVRNNPLVDIAVDTTKLLLERGYKLDKTDLVLRSRRMMKGRTSLTWSKLSHWHRTVQEFNSSKSPYSLLEHFTQLDDVQSISSRLNVSPKEVTFDNVIYCPGIHYRMGFVPKSKIHLLVAGWPKTPKIRLLDREIMRVIDEFPTANIISSKLGKPVSTIVKRLRYLETVRLIRRQLPGFLDITSCQWIPFLTDLPDDLPMDLEEKSIPALTSLFESILANNVPLTISQLSRYFGLTKEEINVIKRDIEKRGGIIEGYFLEGEKEVQLTLPDTLDILNAKVQEEELPENDFSSFQRVDLVPETDPLTVYHLNPLLLSDPTLLPTERQPANSETWLIFWDGIPAGYILKIPRDMEHDKYELEIRVAKNMSNETVISGIIQKMATFMRSWYQAMVKIRSINGLSITDKKWENIHFLIQSLDIEL
jgi:hypothetical protein